MKDRIVVLDLETGGLDAGKHAVIQVAALACTGDFREVIEAAEWKLKFLPEFAQEEALRLNSYNEDTWKKAAFHPAVAVAQIGEFFRRHATHECVSKAGKPYTVARVAGHNAGFDMEFLRTLFAHPGGQMGVASARAFLPAFPRALDTCALSEWAHRIYGWPEPSDYKLGTVAAHLGIDPGDAHDALADCWTALRIARSLTERMLGEIAA